MTAAAQLPLDLETARVEETGDREKLTTMLYNISPELMKDEKNRESWCRQVLGGISRYHQKFALPCKVILHHGIIPEKWQAALPNVKFRHDHDLTAGHYVFANDPTQFTGKMFISVSA